MIRKTHHHTGERFSQMDTDTLRRVMRRTYKFAADSNADQRGAQAELKTRKRLIASYLAEKRADANTDAERFCIDGSAA